MKISCNVNVHHISRVEGHGNIHIKIKGGRVMEAQWEVVETPRFFEAMLVGKKWDNAPWICGRICGICSIGHTLALYFLAAPDFVNAGSVFPLIKSHPDVVARAARLKLLANDACDIIGGRRLHPTRTVVGGFTMLPDKGGLESIKKRLEDAMADLSQTAELFRSFPIPDFSRETEFVSLKGDGDYPFIGGDLVSTDGVRMKEHDYKKMTNEYTIDQSTAKWARLSRESFAVGALARLNNNFAFLHPAARELSESFGLRPVNHNPFMNNVAQLVECVHVTLDSINMISEFLDNEWDEPRQPVKHKKGIGVAAVEVPRGILYHSYEFDRAGKIVKSDCVIPTGQNHANIQHDLNALAAQSASSGKKDSEIELLAEMLVRSYDPCISCSVH
ncbi:MAG: nickel-dependent hydrogenase large subunit [Nitrospirae bacterium]|nr:nickel-dependent hydrogenase large subunit [Nitrospirota bacterium]